MSDLLEPAGMPRRLTALAIDMAACALPVALALVVGALDARALHTPPGWFTTEWLLALWLDAPATITAPLLWWVIAGWLWHLGWELATQRTPGAMALRLRLVDADGQPPSTARVLARAAARLVTLASLGLGYLWILASRQRRAWHGILSGTWVVHA